MSCQRFKSGISGLPVELLTEIIANLGSYSPNPNPVRGLKRDLTACTLVSRLWRGVTRPILFREVTVAFRFVFTRSEDIDDLGLFPPGVVESLESFLNFLRTSSDLGAYIRKIRLDLFFAIETIGESSDLKSLMLAILNRLPSLQELELCDLQFGPPSISADGARDSVASRLGRGHGENCQIIPRIPLLRIVNTHSSGSGYSILSILNILSISAAIGHLEIIDGPPLTIVETIPETYRVPQVASLVLDHKLDQQIFFRAFIDPSLMLDLKCLRLPLTSNWEDMNGFLRYVGPRLERFELILRYDASADEVDLSPCTNLATLVFEFQMTHFNQITEFCRIISKSISTLLSRSSSAPLQIVFSVPQGEDRQCGYRGWFGPGISRHLLRSMQSIDHALVRLIEYGRKMDRNALGTETVQVRGNDGSGFSKEAQVGIRKAFANVHDLGALTILVARL